MELKQYGAWTRRNEKVDIVTKFLVISRSNDKTKINVTKVGNDQLANRQRNKIMAYLTFHK